MLAGVNRERPIGEETEQPAAPINWQPGNSYVHWKGIFRGLSGYAKANRMIVLRLANTLRVSAELALDCPDHDEYLSGRFQFYKRVAVPPNAPSVRFFGPAVESKEDRCKVIYTMMETECVHPIMVGLMNEHYDECWVPTAWNKKTMEDSGLTLPCYVMPLGIDPYVFRPSEKKPIPQAKLITTDDAGKMEVPRGFAFMYLFLPSWRKGADVLLQAFEAAFAANPNVCLVLAMTHSTLREQVTQKLYKDMQSRVYVYKGGVPESGLADLFRSADCYVCTSRGEGWNLPAMEASACGIPCILPRNSVHPELFKDAYLFDTEGVVRCPDPEVISPWYEGMAFSNMEARSHDHLVSLMRHVVLHYDDEAKPKAMAFSRKLRKEVTWDAAAGQVLNRLLEIQP